MDENKATQPTNYCVTIQRQHELLLQEYERVNQEFEEAGQLIGDLQHQLDDASNIDEKRRINSEIGGTYKRWRALRQGRESLRNRIGDIRNDFLISGCQDNIGRL